VREYFIGPEVNGGNDGDDREAALAVITQLDEQSTEIPFLGTSK
jgi:hypothetical protein